MNARVRYILAVLVMVGLGLGTRRFASRLGTLGQYAPDVLWAMMVYFLIAFTAPRAAIWKTGLPALLFSYAIEFSQLYHAAWSDQLRSYQIGGLVLGYGLLLHDLICYTTGVAAAAGMDVLLKGSLVFRNQ